MNTLRIIVTLGLAAAFAGMVLSEDDPTVHLVGMAVPVWLALEACWRLLDPARYAATPARRTGMRRGPKGLPYFW